MKDQQQSFPTPARKILKLSGGQTLAYYVFFEDESSSCNNNNNNNSDDDLHPVLYIHGTPSSALQGSFCATQVHQAGGKLYAIDRPGFGYSDPFPKELTDNNVDADCRLEYICESMWELINHLEWSKFSIIGISGGGIYTLGFLDSYLRRRQGQQQQVAKLEAISIVAGVYAPAGSEGMVASNQGISKAVDGNRTWMLWTMLAMPSIMTKILPQSIKIRLFSTATSEMPQADQDAMADPVVLEQFCTVVTHAMRQGPSWAAPLDIILCFSTKPNQRLEESLKSYFSSSGAISRGDLPLPHISIFHGKEDGNVPVSHGIYVHEQLLAKHSKLHLYDGHGHTSIIVGSIRDDFVRAVIPATPTPKNNNTSPS